MQGVTEDIAQGTVTEAYTSSFPLTEIDDLREYILSKGREEIVVDQDSDEKLKSLFIYKVLTSPNPDKAGTSESIPPIGTQEMGGLCLKTHQSDLFNNWVNKEWVDGDIARSYRKHHTRNGNRNIHKFIPVNGNRRPEGIHLKQRTWRNPYRPR